MKSNARQFETAIAPETVIGYYFGPDAVLAGK